MRLLILDSPDKRASGLVVNLVWINHQRGVLHRYLQKDLFGDWTLICSWGSLDRYHGHVQTEIAKRNYWPEYIKWYLYDKK